MNVDVTTCVQIQRPAPEGGACQRDSDCAAGKCQGGSFRRRCQLESCERSGDCPSGFLCGPVRMVTAGVRISDPMCLSPTGTSCPDGEADPFLADCMSGICKNGRCACGANGSTCATGHDCCDPAAICMKMGGAELGQCKSGPADAGATD
jgi:hypothetical protein